MPFLFTFLPAGAAGPKLALRFPRLFVFLASDDDCASASHLPQLLQKMTAVHGHEEGLLKMLALFHQME